MFKFLKMSCLLSKCCSIKSSVQKHKLAVPANHFFTRKTFNQSFRHQQRNQNYSNVLLKPSLFCISVSSGAIAIAAVIQYERLHSNSRQISNFQDFYKKSIYRQNENILSDLKTHWKNLKASEKIFSTILLLNTIVFLAWQVPRWQHIMIKYFTTDALAKTIPVSSLLLSAFSHSSPVHLAFNMYALHTFCRGVIQPWGEMGPEEFTAMYISSCVVSSLASITFRRIIKSPGISLGASGAILSVVGYFSLSYPNEKLGVIFLPAIQFDAIHALYGLISLDSMGIILRWHMFDHAAHLGGTFFGMFWYRFISTHIWGNRRYIVKKWIALKKIVNEQVRKR